LGHLCCILTDVPPQPNAHSARVLYHCIFYVRTKHTKLLIVKLEVTNVSSYNQKCKEKKKKKKKNIQQFRKTVTCFFFFSFLLKPRKFHLQAKAKLLRKTKTSYFFFFFRKKKRKNNTNVLAPANRTNAN